MPHVSVCGSCASAPVPEPSHPCLGGAAGSPVVFARRVDDSGTEASDEVVNPVYVLVSSGRPADAEAGPTSGAVVERVRLHEAVHLEELQQLLVEGKAGVEIADRKVDVRDVVRLHGRLVTADGGARGRAQTPGSCYAD